MPAIATASSQRTRCRLASEDEPNKRARTNKQVTNLVGLALHGGVRQEQAAGGLLLDGNALHQHAVEEGAEVAGGLRVG